jgi:hypothetical protein
VVSVWPRTGRREYEHLKPTRRVVLEMVEEFVTTIERLDDLVKRD